LIGFSQVDIELGYSQTLTSIIFIVHASAVIALAMTDFTLFYLLPLFFLVLLSAHLILKDLLFNSQLINFLRCFPDEHEWYAEDQQGNTYIISQLCNYSILRGCLIIKLEDDQGRRHWVVVPKDAVDSNAFRRLNVLLQYHLPLQHPANKSLEV